jgi:hypothetical protein
MISLLAKKKNFYELNAGSLPEGEYRFVGSCDLEQPEVKFGRSISSAI